MQLTEEGECTGLNVCVLSPLVLSDSLQPHGLQPSRLLCLWFSSGKNTGLSCHSLLQGTFPIHGLNQRLLHLLHWQVDSLPLCHLGSHWFERRPSKRYVHILPHRPYKFYLFRKREGKLQYNGGDDNGDDTFYDSIFVKNNLLLKVIKPQFANTFILLQSFSFLIYYLYLLLQHFQHFYYICRPGGRKTKVWILEHLSFPFLHPFPPLLPKCLSSPKMSPPLEIFKDLADVRAFTGHRSCTPELLYPQLLPEPRTLLRYHPQIIVSLSCILYMYAEVSE